MRQQSLLNSLESYIQEETGARKRMLTIVERQERAIVSGSALALEQATRSLESELGAQIERTRRRENLFAAFGSLWGISPETLSLSSILERGGDDCSRLAALRRELRDATASLARRNRRLAALMTLHRRVVHDLIGCLAQDDGASALSASGTLIDAEA